MTKEGEKLLPREMDDKHLVNCIRLMEKRTPYPFMANPIYADLVEEAHDRGIAIGQTIGQQLTVAARKYNNAAESMARLTKWQESMSERNARLSAIAHKAVATRRLNDAKKARKEKLFKKMTKPKVVVRVVDVRARRILLED